MKNAKEMYELYEEAIKKEEEAEREQALQILENEVAPLMEAAARRGESNIDYRAPSIIAAKAMTSKLEELGYGVLRKNARLNIIWVLV